MAELDFNTTDYLPSDAREILPDGIYSLFIKSEEMKDTSSGNGRGLSLTYEVLEGDYKGVTFTHWINVSHTSEITQRIGRRELRSLELACGLDNIKNTAELAGKIFMAEVATQPESTSKNGTVYGPRNFIKKFHKSAAGPSAVPTVAAPVTPTVAPWAK